MATYSANQPPTNQPPETSTITAPSPIPSHPAPTDAANTSSGVAVDGTRPDEISEREAQKDWKPNFDRRQSWKKEDQKHELQMNSVGNFQAGPGFSERR